MSSKLLSIYARPDDKGLSLLRNAMERLNLSARAYDRILKVARTIADLEGSEQILSAHLAEAISIGIWIERTGRDREPPSAPSCKVRDYTIVYYNYLNPERYHTKENVHQISLQLSTQRMIHYNKL